VSDVGILETAEILDRPSAHKYITRSKV
jgi:hypothetical protein